MYVCVLSFLELRHISAMWLNDLSIFLVGRVFFNSFLTQETVHELVKCDHSNELLWELGGQPALLSSGKILKCPIEHPRKPLNSFSCLSTTVYYTLLTKSYDCKKYCNRAFKTNLYWAVLLCGAVYYAVHGGSKITSLYEVLKSGHSNESYWKVLSCVSFINCDARKFILRPWVKS